MDNIETHVKFAMQHAELAMNELRYITGNGIGSPIERAAVPHLQKRASELHADLYQLLAALRDSK